MRSLSAIFRKVPAVVGVWPTSTWWTFQIFLFSFLFGEDGKGGGVRGAGRGRFQWKIQGVGGWLFEGSLWGGGGRKAARAMSVGWGLNCFLLAPMSVGVGAKSFCPGPKIPQSFLIVQIDSHLQLHYIMSVELMQVL